MDDQELDRLSRMTTCWSEVRKAHEGSASGVAAAQQALLQRYGRPIKRYLLGAIRDPDGADELAQEFALRVVKGYFRHADPDRGRFRDFIKKVLKNLIADYCRRRKGQPGALPDDLPAPPADEGGCDSDEELVRHWRDELLRRAWDGLARIEQQTGRPFFTALRFRADHPGMPSLQMAEELTVRMKPARPFTDTGIRKTLQRAREQYADLLLQEAERLLQTNTKDRLEEGLIDLGLFSYCQSALTRYKSKP